MKNSITIQGITIANEDGIQWIIGVVESRLKTSSNPQETLEQLAQGIIPKRGSSGPRTEEWHGELVSIVKSYLASFSLRVNLRESGGMDNALNQLAKRMNVNREDLEKAIETRAKKVHNMKKSLMDDITMLEESELE